jgi:hypothetical protein
MTLLLVGCTGSFAIANDLLLAIGSMRISKPTPAVTTTLESLPARLPDTSQASDHTLAIVTPENSSVERYGSLELDLQTSLQAANPYDPNEIEIKVRFKAPSGREVDVGAFWYQEYDLQTRQTKGSPGWKVRFTPDETGDWNAVAYANNLGVQSKPFSFSVTASNRTGFVRINPTNSRYLAFDNGNFFFPIGLNMGWWKEGSDPVDQYGEWFDEFTANGGNTIRVWMATWSFGIEWKDTGLGDYDHRLYEAWLLDQLFRLADEHGVKIILVLMNHGPFSTYANSEWDDNPYNAALGGPISTPEQFVSDPIARSYFQRRLDYIINRWGYSDDLLAWEWWNEVNLTPITDDALIPWLQEMTAYLRQRDVNHHLTTSSYAMSSLSPIWQLPEVDIAQQHEYSSQINVSDHDLAARTAQDFQAFAQTIPAKPILMGEFGYSASNYGDDIEPTGIHLHNGLWATTFSGYAGTGMYWWWDNYIDANDLWYHFKGLSQFLIGVNLTKYQPFSPLQITGRGGNPGQVDGLGLRGEDTLIWIRNDGYTVQASIAARDGKPISTTYIPPMVESLHLTLSEVDNGAYRVRWYDSQMARWLDTDTVIAHDNMLNIPIPPFRYDLAAEIIRNP